MTRTEPENLHARINRARKVSAMVEFLDQLLEANGLDPFVFARALPQVIQKITADDWARIALNCGQRKPSKTTIETIVATYNKRSEESQQEAS
jgi:histidinol phosphatase-like enzyme